MAIKHLFFNIASLAILILAFNSPISSMEEPDKPSCKICFDTFDNTSELSVLTCNHIFCTGCIKKWSERSNTCPVCRAEIEYNSMPSAEYVDSYYNPTIHAVERCGICKQAYKIADLITILPCNSGHIFHDKCITRHILAYDGRAACPLCHAPINIESQIEEAGSDQAESFTSDHNKQDLDIYETGLPSCSYLPLPKIKDRASPVSEQSYEFLEASAPGADEFDEENYIDHAPSISIHDLEQCFINAIKDDDPVIAQLCIEKGIDPNMGALIYIDGASIMIIKPLPTEAVYKNEFLNSKLSVGSLHLAAYYGSSKVTELLLRYTDVNKQTNHGATALICAVSGGYTNEVALLLARHADVNIQDEDGRTALSYSAHDGNEEEVELLIHNGADVNITDKHGMTALSYSAWIGYKKIVELLLAHGAEVNVTSQGGRTALSFASEYGHKKVVELLLAHGGLIHISSMEEPNKPSSKICFGTDGNNSDQRPTIGINDLEECFIQAIKNDDPMIARLCIEKGIDPNIGALIDRASNTVKALPAEKIDSSVKSFRTQVDLLPLGSLHLAAFYGSRKVAELLLKYSIEIDNPAALGRNALHWAADCGHIEIVKLLIKHGAKLDTKARTCLGLYEPIHFAAQAGFTDIIQTLIEYGANINVTTGQIVPPQITPLNLAIWREHVETVKFIACNGAELNMPHGRDGLYPLHLAIRSAASEDIRLAMVACLLKNGANLYAQTTDGEQPIHFAARAGSVDVVQMLVQRGADINALTHSGQRPIDIAQSQGRSELVNWLDSQTRQYETSRHQEREMNDQIERRISHGVQTRPQPRQQNLPQHLSLRYSPRRYQSDQERELSDINNALENNDIDFIKRFLEEKYMAARNALVYQGITHMHAAAIHGNIELGKLLVSHGAKLNETVSSIGRGRSGMQPIHFAAMNGNVSFLEWLLSQGINSHALAATIFNSDSSLGISANDYMEPIHFAASKGKINIIESLIKQGVSVSTSNQAGNQAVHFAAKGGHTKLIKWLKNNGASLNAENKQGKRASHFARAAGHKNLAEMLTQAESSCLIS